ncbi:MAG: hypothetical protein QOF89_2999 [Acidobacteriota bacterium]|jgi:hypothetical protein|nr:hypothetical protein [Acidobacteriota bacterium]
MPGSLEPYVIGYEDHYARLTPAVYQYVKFKNGSQSS